MENLIFRIVASTFPPRFNIVTHIITVYCRVFFSHAPSHSLTLTPTYCQAAELARLALEEYELKHPYVSTATRTTKKGTPPSFSFCLFFHHNNYLLT